MLLVCGYGVVLSCWFVELLRCCVVEVLIVGLLICCVVGECVLLTCRFADVLSCCCDELCERLGISTSPCFLCEHHNKPATLDNN